MKAAKFQTLLMTAACAGCLLVGSASAATVGYWQFGDAADGVTASTIATQVNAATLNGTASGHAGGSAPVHAAEAPGLLVLDGVGGAVINTANTISLRMTSSGDYAGGIVSVADPGGAGSLLKPHSFTMEGFIRIDQMSNWPTVFGKARTDSNGVSWTMDLNGDTSPPIDPANQNNPRVRVDSQPLGFGNGTSGFNQGFNNSSIQLEDGGWHHVAITYDGDSHTLSYYVDYALGKSGTTTNGMVYDDSSLFFGNAAGGRAFDGWIDEYRLSDTVLAPDQFLVAVPTPAALPAGLVLIALIGLRRRT